ncbi:MAG: hypothetical protein KJZ80_20775 [Hyphomicrobiaceae bacterium]|nr:hypothetical protein [Hyphomicrobiaceae bacterium]
MAQDPKIKRDKTPDLSLVGPSAPAASQSAPARTKAATVPPPLPPAAASSTGGAAQAAARSEPQQERPAVPLPAPAAQSGPEAASTGKPAATAELAREPARNSPPPPPSPLQSGAGAKVVRPLKLSELQRTSDVGWSPARAPGTGPAEEASSSGAPEAHRPAAAAAEPDQQSAPGADPGPGAAAGPGSGDRGASDETSDRRPARRRPAGPSRARIAANDDAPSIGGLIYALNEKPSNRPFVFAAAASGVWAAIGIAFAWAFISRELGDATGLFDAIGRPATLSAFATVVGPIALFWFLALLVWRTEDLRLRSTAMTEVAVRLAEPDRMAEQSIASLGQAVRRQVSFMNDAVSRALGRAGELEALVHNEVTALERSYEDNERKIRSLIQELSGERNALLNTTERVNDSLKSIAGEVPVLIEKLSHQQVKLATIIEGAGENLTALETSLAEQTGRLEHTLGSRTEHMQGVLRDYTAALGSALGSRTDQMQAVLEQYTASFGHALSSRSEQMQLMFEGYKQNIDSSLANRTENLQTVFEEYARALDSTLANRAQALDMQLVQRTAALDQAFSERLKAFDESILRSTLAIDSAIGEKAEALTGALDNHARSLTDSIGRQAVELDETLMQGIAAVRRTSENITRQSVKAIEGLSSQSELLKNVSENLLSQINSVTNRFEGQGQTIMRAANALESANYKIDATLQSRHEELSGTLERMTGKAEEMGRVMSGASSSLEGSLTQAEQRARQLTHELTKGAEVRSRSAIAEIERMKIAANVEADRAFDELTARFSHVSRQVSEQLSQLQSQFNATSTEVRMHAQRAASELASEQARLRRQIEALPHTTRESSEAVRKALSDQLRALEELSNLTAREAARRDVMPPGPIAGGPLTPVPTPPDKQRSLSSLTSTLANELGQRQRRASLPVPGTPAATETVVPATEARESWSLGDLLARASREEEGAPRQLQQAAPPAPGKPPSINIELLARALDPATASAIWSRFRAGQRGIMVRSIYSTEGRTAFDEASRRFRTDPIFQQMVNRYLDEFERSLREGELQEGSARLLANQLVSDTGRVYLLLAHASGRLS